MKRTMKITKKIILMAACFVMLSASHAAAKGDDVCAEGDKKCGPDGYVMECRRWDMNYNAMYQEGVTKWYSTSTTCAGPASDSAGSSEYKSKDIRVRKKKERRG